MMLYYISLIPQTYAQWRHCITVECGILLTHDFIIARLAVWRDSGSEETRRFVRLYGEAHRQAIIRWFEQAGQALATG